MDADADTTNRIHFTTEPLRLALTREQFQFAERMPGCERMERAPEERWLTRELAPHLRFLGSIRSGCGTETGGGAGLSYTIEVKRDFFVVASIGAWLTPRIGGVRENRVDPVARLDLVWRMRDGSAFNFGLFASNTTIGIGFGFVW
jgi:hypothetical protein